MNGKRFHIKLIIAVILPVMLMILAPWPCMGATSQELIVILVSDVEDAYGKALDAYVEEADFPVRIINLKGQIDKAGDVMANVIALKPALIFCLGAKASYIAKVWTADRPDIPVIFAMVLNPEKYELNSGQSNIAGIATEVDPGAQFANLSLFFPKIRNIGLIYSPEHSSQLIEHAEKTTALLGMKLITSPITSPNEFRKAYLSIREKIDAFWVIADPVVYRVRNMAWLEKRCIEDQLICMGPSENIAKLGLVLSVNPDLSSIGSQAVSMTNDILRYGNTPNTLGIQPPLGTVVTLNMKTVRKLDLEIDPKSMNMASEIIND